MRHPRVFSVTAARWPVGASVEITTELSIERLTDTLWRTRMTDRNGVRDERYFSNERELMSYVTDAAAPRSAGHRVASS